MDADLAELLFGNCTAVEEVPTRTESVEVLLSKPFAVLRLQDLSEPTINDRAIDTLVMKGSNKNAIKAIVRSYTDRKLRRRSFAADFIRGKGEGQILLLHGPPGTGKTLTADDVDENLWHFFHQAHRWDAVVLLDKADVYLEARDSNDLERNSIVAVFLRAMEYFQGILFLTTNRVGQLDEAFQSRIHVSIGYPPLDEAARSQIWDNLFRKLEDDFEDHEGPGIVYDYSAKEYAKGGKDMKALDWNGREIRNAFQTVVALAIFDAREQSERQHGKKVTPKIRDSHLQTVVTMSNSFKDYMKSTHDRLSPAQRAHKLGNRDDSFHKDGGGVDVKKKGYLSDGGKKNDGRAEKD